MLWLISRLLRGRRGSSDKQPARGGNLLAFWKLLRANMLTFLRERATLFWTFAFPLLFIVIFGGLFGGNQSPSYSVGVAGDSTSTAGQAILTAFQQTKVFTLHPGDLNAELKSLKDGNRDAVLDLPASVGTNQSPAQVKVYYDPTISSNQTILLPIVDQVLAGVNQRLSGVRPLLVAAPATIQTHQLRPIDFLLPGILAMALMQLGLFSAQAIVTQRETRVLRRLGATPLPRAVLIGSQVAARLLIAVLQAVVLLIVARALFKFQISGSVTQVAVFVALGALTFVALGYVVAAVSPTAETAQPVAQAISFPMLFLSGVFFPISLIPNIVQPIVRVLPLTYLSDALRQAAAGGTPYSPLWVDGVVLVAWLGVCLAVSVRFFRWE